MSHAKQRLLLIAGIAGYVALFQWMYINYLYPTWEYFGFGYNDPCAACVSLAWFLSLAPSFWMPIELQRPSQLAYWVLYLTVFIPSMFVPMYAGLDSPGEIRNLMLVLFAGFVIAGGSYLFPLFRFRPSQISPRFFWELLACVAGAMSLWMLVIFRHHLHIVSFQDVYDLRDAANDVAEGSQVNYAFMLLTGALNPFLMGCGLYYKRGWLFLAGAAGQLLVFAVGGTKGSILSLLFVPGFALLLRPGRMGFALKVAYGTLAVLGFACLSYFFSDYDPGPLLTTALFVILMRTLSINGLLTAQYYHFFQQNPFTHLSHIKGVNWLVHYPYQYSVGQEIGLAYAGTTDLDSTAHFWVADGIGGFGLPGILLVSIFCAGVFWILDSASQRHDPRLAALVTTYAAYNLANISLFTTLLSGGLALLMLLLYLMPAPSGGRELAFASEGTYRFRSKSVLRPLPSV